MNGTKSSKKTLPADLLSELERLQRSNDSTRKAELSGEQIELLRIMPQYHREQFARVWKNRYGWGSEKTLRRYYQDLFSGSKA